MITLLTGGLGCTAASTDDTHEVTQSATLEPGETALVDLDPNGVQFPYGLGGGTTVSSALPIAGTRSSITEDGRFIAFRACLSETGDGACEVFSIYLRDLSFGHTYPVSVDETTGETVDGTGPHVTSLSSYNWGDGTYTYNVFVSFGSFTALTGEEEYDIGQVFVRHFVIHEGAVESAQNYLVSRVEEYWTADCYTSDAPHAIDGRWVDEDRAHTSPSYPYVTVAYGCSLQSDDNSHSFLKTLRYSGDEVTVLEAAQIDIDPDSGSKLYATVNPSVHVFSGNSRTYAGDAYVAFEGQITNVRSPRQIWLRHAYDFDHSDGSLVQLCTSRTVCYEPSVALSSSGVWVAWRQSASGRSTLRLASFGLAGTENGRVQAPNYGSKPSIILSSDSLLMSYEYTSGSAEVEDVYAYKISTSTYSDSGSWIHKTVSIDSEGGAANADSYDAIVASSGEVLFTSWASDFADDVNGTENRDLFLHAVQF